MRLPVVPTIVLAQLFGTSLWFSANSAADDLARAWTLAPGDIGRLTNAVQLGFILGTLGFSLTGLADRYAASRIFALCAVLGAAANAAFALLAQGLESGLALRFAVGLSLAGVYPLGMKLVVSWVPERAGAALAQLVGMLTLGTALPHGVRLMGVGWPWQGVILVSSALAVVAAGLILALGDGPHLGARRAAPSALKPPRGAASKASEGVVSVKRRKDTPPLRLGAVLTSFARPQFRASALGYFGHMWELYAFWTLVPMLLASTGLDRALGNASGLAFAIIGIGALGCIAGGQLSQRIGSARVAALALTTSALCCALFPLASGWAPWALFGLMLAWGASVVADSPHFSALSARACPPENVGSALAFQNAIGFGITLISIHWGTRLVPEWGMQIAWFLLPGPLLGLIALAPLWRRPATP